MSAVYEHNCYYCGRQHAVMSLLLRDACKHTHLCMSCHNPCNELYNIHL